eukprot:SAG22_NODE_1328_length_4724_cov_8.803243_3_plen_248_part_00
MHNRALGLWAAYNATYGLAAARPDLPTLRLVVPACLATLGGNPDMQTAEDLLVAREHAAFLLGELVGAAVASDALRPALLASADGLDLALAAAAALAAGLTAEPAAVRFYVVPQYAPLVEAAASVGQPLAALAAQDEFGGSQRAGAVQAQVAALVAGLQKILGLAAAAADSDEAAATAAAAAAAEGVKLGADDSTHARIALARLGVGDDARGVPIKEVVAAQQRTLNVPLMLLQTGPPDLKFSIRNT